jgi:hypothetical protein
MIAFGMSGGIGDAILGQPIVKKIKEVFNEEVALFYYDKTVGQVLSHNYDFAHGPFFTNGVDGRDKRALYKEARKQGCSLLIFNSFLLDNDDQWNIFYALDESRIDIVRERREVHLKSFNEKLKTNVDSLNDLHSLTVLNNLGLEDSYYADFRRYGFDVSEEEIVLDIPDWANEKTAEWRKNNPEYAVIHDSRLETKYRKDKEHAILKSWYADRWEGVAQYQCRLYSFIGRVMSC